VTPGQDGDPAAAEPTAAGPPDRGRAETYLRLRVEAELRRMQALPRPEPGEHAVPAPLRGAARLVLPPGRRAAGILLPLAGQAAQALQSLAENTTRALQPLVGHAGRTLPPIAGNAARTLRPLADHAARALQPLAVQVIGAVLPAADQAARRLHPLAWEAGYRLQALPRSAGYRLTRRRAQAYRVTATLRGTRASATPGRWEPPAGESPDEGVRRLRRVAHALDQAGAIDRRAADSILAGLETALAARSRIDDHRLVMRSLHATRHQQPARAPAGPYLAVPIGAALPAGPDSGLTDVRLLTLVIGPHTALIYATGQVPEQSHRSQHLDPWPLFGAGQPSAADDRGNSYEIDEDSGMSDGDGHWSGILRFSPVPPSGIQWLELTMSPGSPAIRVDLANPGESERAPRRPPAGGPAERLIDGETLDLLQLSVTDEESLPRHDLSSVADIVTALEAVGALDSARRAVGRLVTLAGRLGVELPPALRAAAPPGRLPAAWASVLENRHRRDGPRGAVPAAAVLPELDGTRFVLAGLRSDAARAELHVMGWGPQHEPRPLEGAADPWSWSARDDQGRWHIATVGGSSIFSDNRRHLQLHLVPPLHPQATSLEVTIAGPPGQVTATVPLDWEGPR